MASKGGIKLDKKRAMSILKSAYTQVCNNNKYLDSYKNVSKVNPKIARSIGIILNSKRAKSFKYALLTQVLAKVVEPRVNARVLQKVSGKPGAFDPRTFCREVVVPFEREYLNNVLGGAPDPYVNKPLRHEEITLDSSIYNHIRYQYEWKELHNVVTFIEDNPSLANDVLVIIMNVICSLKNRVLLSKEEIREATMGGRIMPLSEILSIVNEYLTLEYPSLGSRSQIVTYTALETLGGYNPRFKLNTGKSTAADVVSEKVSDIECYIDDRLILAVAVKDNLTSNTFEEEISKVPPKLVSHRARFLIVVSKPIPRTLENKIQKGKQEVWEKYKIEVDVIQLLPYLWHLLILVPPEGLAHFVENLVKNIEKLGDPNDVVLLKDIIKRHS